MQIINGLQRESMDTHPEVIVVGALATKVSNIAPMQYSAEAIAGDQARIHYVHGGMSNSEGGLSVATPSQQAAEIAMIIEDRPEQPFVVLSQSMGALAALMTVERFDGARVNAISVAPPLLYPSDVLRHPRIGKMSEIIDGQLMLPSRSFALGDRGPIWQPNGTDALPDPVLLSVPQELFNEVDEVDGAYWDRTAASIEAGRLHVVMPNEDWNVAGLKVSESLPRVTRLEGPHSLITEPELLSANIASITALARSFAISSERVESPTS